MAFCISMRAMTGFSILHWQITWLTILSGPIHSPTPYAVNANRELIELFQNEDFKKGITISTPGFYAPQGRRLRLETFDNEINNKLAEFSFRGRTISNYEMESSAIYGLSALLGHKALTICLVIGNRVTGEFVQDYKPLMNDLALKVLKQL